MTTAKLIFLLFLLVQLVGGLDVPAGGALTGTLGGGTIRLQGSAIVPAGEVVIFQAGTRVEALSPSAQLNIHGTLIVQGTAEERIHFGSVGEGGWLGIVVTGEFRGSGVDLRDAQECILGLEGSVISLSDTTMVDCRRSLRLLNGGRFDNTTIVGGNTIAVRGGILRMSDTLVDFLESGAPPDCTKFFGGGAILDHVHFTACHCPLHFDSATDNVLITNSIFDMAAYPAMVARMNANFTGNHFLMNGGPAIFRSHLLDIGGGITLHVAGNYWGGTAPKIFSTSQRQFIGAEDYSADPLPGVGPRYR